MVVRLRGGKTESDDDPQIIDAVLVACVYDPDPGRQGYRDALHIINKIYPVSYTHLMRMKPHSRRRSSCCPRS